MSFLSDLISRHPAETGLSVAGLIVVFGLLVYGFADLARFGPRRVWALSGVVFRESIRRKVLWLTPMAMLGIVVLTGLQRPEDESDAIRQTIQFCLFASGLLVVVTGVMLSCTNLPKDIESKVVFTIVTKPTTRFEIVLGKVIGFARVTGMIVLLMGLFTWGFCHARAWQLGGDVSRKLAGALENEFARNRLEHYRDAGLLATRTLATPSSHEVLAVLPKPGETVRWISTEQNAFVPFETDPDALRPRGLKDDKGQPVETAPGEGGLYVAIGLGALQVAKSEVAETEFTAPLLAPTTREASVDVSSIAIAFTDRRTGAVLIDPSQLNGGKPIQLRATPDGKPARVLVPVSPQIAPVLAEARQWGMRVVPANGNFLISVDPAACGLVVPGLTKDDERHLPAVMGPDGKTPAVEFHANNSGRGPLLSGPKKASRSFAIYHFDRRPDVVDGKATVELQCGIERVEGDATEIFTRARVGTIAPGTNELRETTLVTPENNRSVYVSLPAAAFADGPTDVVVETLTPGHALILNKDPVTLVGDRGSFAANLAKALFSQWMLSVLVVTVGFFCSTFVSWPLAIVLSLFVLTGHWAVNQLSDSLQPGIGALLATDLGATDASQARVISSTFDGLARLLNVVAQFLPNLDFFSVVGSLERGLSIAWSSLASGAAVLAVFGLPLLALSYVFLRNKEVAP